MILKITKIYLNLYSIVIEMYVCRTKNKYSNFKTHVNNNYNKLPF